MTSKNMTSKQQKEWQAAQLYYAHNWYDKAINSRGLRKADCFRMSWFCLFELTEYQHDF